MNVDTAGLKGHFKIVPPLNREEVSRVTTECREYLYLDEKRYTTPTAVITETQGVALSFSCIRLDYVEKYLTTFIALFPEHQLVGEVLFNSREIADHEVIGRVRVVPDVGVVREFATITWPS